VKVLARGLWLGNILLSMFNYYFLTSMGSYAIVELIFRATMDYESYIRKNGIDPTVQITMFIGLTLIPLLTLFLTYITAKKMKKLNLPTIIIVFIGNLLLALLIYSIL